MSDTTPSPSASERAERACIRAGVNPASQVWRMLESAIIREITAAEQAAEARGAERMRERCVAEINSQARRWRRRNVNLASIADDIATALAALPLEEGEG